MMPGNVTTIKGEAFRQDVISQKELECIFKIQLECRELQSRISLAYQQLEDREELGARTETGRYWFDKYLEVCDPTSAHSPMVHL
jgi:hypothetical protein